MRRAEQHAGHKTGFPHPGAGGAVALQQGLGNDATEHQLLSHAHKDHVQHKGQDAGQRQQRRVRAVKGQRPNGRIPDEEQRVHTHQQAIEKAAAAAAQQPGTVCPYQKQHRHQCAHQLLQGAVEVCIQCRKICPEQHQHNGKDQVGDKQACQKDHFGQNTEYERVRSAQSFEHEVPS